MAKVAEKQTHGHKTRVTGCSRLKHRKFHREIAELFGLTSQELRRRLAAIHRANAHEMAR